MAKRLPVVLNDEERKALMDQANKRYITGERNRVIMQLMFNLGLRLAEVVNLKWQDIDFLTGVLMVREGKGCKDRTLYISNKNWRGDDDKGALEAWRKRQAEDLGAAAEYVFTTTTKGNSGHKLLPRYIQSMVGRYTKRAGITKTVSPHTLRHTFASDFYRHTKDLVKVKNALGHSDISTTMVYVHLNGHDLESALAWQD